MNAQARMPNEPVVFDVFSSLRRVDLPIGHWEFGLPNYRCIAPSGLSKLCDRQPGPDGPRLGLFRPSGPENASSSEAQRADRTLAGAVRHR